MIRPITEDDVEPLGEIYRQPAYLAMMPATDAAEQIELWKQRWDVDGFGHWAVCERESGRLIGRVGLLRHRDWPLVPEAVEVGWVLDHAYWGHGLATEGGRAAVDAWRRHLPDEEFLYSFASPRNTRSRAVTERLGMTFGGSTVWRGLEHVWSFLRRVET